MNKLNERVKITEKRKRVGRGGSRGGTSGKGHKGQKARTGGSGKLRAGFEGGQMPLHRRLPKRGFTNARFKKEFALVNIDQLQEVFTEGAEISRVSLLEKGLIRNTTAPIKLLGRGKLSKKFIVTVDACSAEAKQAITTCGGEIHLI